MVKSHHSKNKKKRKSYDTDNGIVVYFDGSCLPNPYGHMGIGCHILNNRNIIYNYSGYFLPSKDNSSNVAEYLALTNCLTFLLENGFQEEVINVYGDSSLAINQMSGKMKIGQGLYVDYARECKEVLKNFKKVNFTWINRDLNQIADRLSKKAYDDNNVQIIDQEELIRKKSSDITKLCFPFGKFIHQPICNADLNYVNWLLENVAFNHKTAHIEKALKVNYHYFVDKAAKGNEKLLAEII